MRVNSGGCLPARAVSRATIGRGAVVHHVAKSNDVRARQALIAPVSSRVTTAAAASAVRVTPQTATDWSSGCNGARRQASSATVWRRTAPTRRKSTFQLVSHAGVSIHSFSPYHSVRARMVAFKAMRRARRA